MCQANIIMQNSNGGEEILKDVIHLRVDGDTIWFSRFFEEPVAVQGAINEIDFLKHTVKIIPESEVQG
jgi:predicted RNA-binding protein